ncbi:MAG: phosphoenolpyruvate carboxykinase [Luteitalea sp.]|nr:phosphoenolpyruvate carboxykinase [Luteitalea sp.]
MSLRTEQDRSLQDEGIQDARPSWNLTGAALYEEAIRRREGLVAADGPLVCRTGHHTGRSPNDKFIVREPSSERDIAWGGSNREMSVAHFDALRRDLFASMSGAEIFVQDCHAGADPRYRLPVRVITEYAWHSLFARNLLIVDPDAQTGQVPQLTIVDSPSFRADPARHGTNSEVVVALNFAERLVLIAGTSYAGEIKKSVFSTLNYLLPLGGVMPMHCSANVGSAGDVALFFGLSGTGKTSLSSDPERGLIGDDEHGWSDHGVFNFEGGCYAKTIRLSAEAEPEIYATTRRFGTVLENVVIDPETRRLNLDDDRFTENTRAAYPISFISNAVPSGQGTHPRNIVMLTADAFGVLPPVSRLSPAGAMYHFLSGYTAKVAGTEKGVTEPKATFSTCFGAPFLPLPPSRYAGMLGERIERHQARVWLVNTGWTGGPYGTGSRMKIKYTRAMIHAALSGVLDGMRFERDPIFNLDVPQSCPNVPADVLNPRNTWANKADYDAQARKLAAMFAENFRTFESAVAADVRTAGPHV